MITPSWSCCTAQGHPTRSLSKRLAHIPGVTERIAARLRPDREPMRLPAHRDDPDCAGCRVDVVDDIVVAPGQPKLLPVCADVAHVGAAATGNGPGLLDLAGCEVDHRD